MHVSDLFFWCREGDSQPPKPGRGWRLAPWSLVWAVEPECGVDGEERVLVCEVMRDSHELCGTRLPAFFKKSHYFLVRSSRHSPAVPKQPNRFSVQSRV